MKTKAIGLIGLLLLAIPVIYSVEEEELPIGKQLGAVFSELLSEHEAVIKNYIFEHE